jgi:predicted DNA-binding protein YlxM (UPF0122 family)
MTEAQKRASRKYQNKKNKEIRDRGKCVYLHRNPKTKEVFYVGIGVETRAKDFSKRSIFWSNYKNKYGIEVDIIKKGLSSKKAQNIEVELIKKYGRRDLGTGSLVNLSHGGEGIVPRGVRALEKKPCICLITGKVYECLSKYSEDTGIPFTTLSGHFSSHRFNKSPEKYKVRLIGKDNKIIWEKDKCLTTTEITNDYMLEDYDYDNDLKEQNKIDDINLRMSELSQYDKGLIDLYYYKDMSLRSIQKATNIGLSSIHNSIKDIRLKLRGDEVKNYNVKRSNIKKLDSASKTKIQQKRYLIMNSKEIKPTDGRKGNSRKKSIPKLPIPQGERSNKPALNQAKKSRKKQYAKKAIKNVFGSEVAMFESMAKKAKEGSYNHMKLLTDMMYEEDKENTGTTVKAPIINFFGDNDVSKKIKDKIIDITPKDEE